MKWFRFILFPLVDQAEFVCGLSLVKSWKLKMLVVKTKILSLISRDKTVEEIIAWSELNVSSQFPIVAFTYKLTKAKTYVAEPYWCSTGQAGLFGWYCNRLTIGFATMAKVLQESLFEPLASFSETMTKFADSVVASEVDSGLAQIYDQLGKEGR